MAKGKYTEANIQSFKDVVTALNNIIDVGSIGYKESDAVSIIADVSSCGGSGVGKMNLITPNVAAHIANMRYSFSTAFTASEYHIVVAATDSTGWSETSLIDKLQVTDCAALVNTVVSVSPSVTAKLSAGTFLTINLSSTGSGNYVGNFSIVYDTWPS